MGVWPSAPSQISVPTGFRVLRVLSSARRITASPSYTRQAVREFRARYCSGTIDHLPEAGIGPKAKINRANHVDEVSGDLEYLRRQPRISGEEQDVREQSLERLPRRDGVDGMPAAVTQEIDAPEPGGAVVPGPRELPPERRSVAVRLPLGNSHDGELIAQQGHVCRQSRERRLAAARGTGEEMGPAASDQAGGMHDEATRLDERERDRKSTRLNSSHLVISYAVFCLKKKK